MSVVNRLEQSGFFIQTEWETIGYLALVDWYSLGYICARQTGNKCLYILESSTCISMPYPLCTHCCCALYLHIPEYTVVQCTSTVRPVYTVHHLCLFPSLVHNIYLLPLPLRCPFATLHYPSATPPLPRPENQFSILW